MHSLIRLSLLATLLPAALWFSAGCQTQSSTPTPGSVSGASDGRVQVMFENSAKYTDVRSTYQGSADQGYLDELQRYIDRMARTYLPDGLHLMVRFNDIDMAGDFEPWRPQATDVRIVKDIYVPRLKFSYTISDAAGNVVSEGEENLTDLTFQTRVRIDTHDPLFYEKSLLDDWMRAKLGK